MSPGNGARPNLFMALAGIEAGIVGGLILLGYLTLDSAWHRRGFWAVPNLLASTFYGDRKSTRLNSSHVSISYAVFCLKKKNKNNKVVVRRQNSYYTRACRRRFHR